MPRSPKTETRMDLILWRHAEAEEATGKLPDARRRLTPRGEKQACQMAQWLKKRLPKKLRVLVSPTERTQMTAHALGLPFEVEDRIGPNAEAHDLLAAASWPNHNGTVLLVGHQPTLGHTAALILTGTASDWALKKGSVWWFSSRTREGEVQQALRAVIGAEML